MCILDISHSKWLIKEKKEKNKTNEVVSLLVM